MKRDKPKESPANPLEYHSLYWPQGQWLVEAYPLLGEGFNIARQVYFFPGREARRHSYIAKAPGNYGSTEALSIGLISKDKFEMFWNLAESNG